MTWRRILTCAAMAAALALGWGSPEASASHYRISPGFELVTKAERATLAKAGVTTTAQLLKATAKRSARKAFAKKTGLALKRLAELARQCDLLRVKGLGPSGVRLLQAAKLPDVAALKGASAKALHAKLETLKATLNLPHVVPTSAELSSWITQAKALPRILEGAR